MLRICARFLQGYVLSLFVFLMHMDRICRRRLDLEGVNISDVAVRILLFGEDDILLTRFRQEFQSLLNRFNLEFIAARMKLIAPNT